MLRVKLHRIHIDVARTLSTREREREREREGERDQNRRTDDLNPVHISRTAPIPQLRLSVFSVPLEVVAKAAKGAQHDE